MFCTRQSSTIRFSVFFEMTDFGANNAGCSWFNHPFGVYHQHVRFLLLNSTQYPLVCLNFHYYLFSWFWRRDGGSVLLESATVWDVVFSLESSSSFIILSHLIVPSSLLLSLIFIPLLLIFLIHYVVSPSSFLILGSSSFHPHPFLALSWFCPSITHHLSPHPAMFFCNRFFQHPTQYLFLKHLIFSCHQPRPELCRKIILH